MRHSPTVDDVRAFWEDAPLFVGESQFPAGSADFFQEHARVIIEDGFAGAMDERIFPENRDAAVLDLGCGPGFWVTQFASRGYKNLHGADLTERALEIAATRCRLLGISCSFQRENAETLSFADNSFDHVNCQGVIHHTPNTAACVREIARVLKPGGTACLSVYFKNLFLRQWWWLRHPARLASFFGAKLKGRGREGIFATPDVNNLVRLYDGNQNPVGKAFSRSEFRALLVPVFHIDDFFLHFFPRRSLPIPIGPTMHRWLDRHFGFMIYARVRKEGLPTQARVAA
jgi:SAM-dependent methyltransferase